MKRIIALALAVVLCLSLAPGAFAAGNEAERAADELYSLGLFVGTGTDSNGNPIYELDRAPNRYEGIIMLVRLLGKMNEAKQGSYDMPFTDVADWAAPYVAYAYANGLTSGVSATEFGGSTAITATQYITFVLRALGYSGKTDFSWDEAWLLSDKLGFTNGEYNDATNSSFLRGDAAVISLDALSVTCKNSTETLLEHIGITGGDADTSDEHIVDLCTLMESVNDAREALIKSPATYEGYEDYLVTDPETINLLTKEEMEVLLHPQGDRPNSVTYEQAVSDVDLMFRVLHSTYGAYYYFGKEAFDAAEAEVMEWLSGKSTVWVQDLTNVMRESLDFMVDAHSFVGFNIDELEGIRYEYFDCEGQVYDKDSRGYFKTVNGERLYFVSFSDANASMQPTLLENGEIVYSPALFCTEIDLTPTVITLCGSDGSAKTETIQWQETTALGYNGVDYHFAEANGFAYISMREFSENDYPALYAEFSASGSEVKDCKAIIFDLRSNSGGNGSSMDEWTYNFTGEYPEPREARASRISMLNGMVPVSFYELNFMNQGKWLPNDIPIIVLVDDMCASAGEFAMNTLRSMDNVVVVGSNSAGYQLGGNAVWVTLPNTKIGANVGTSLRFMYEVENVDCVGYMPDVWCDPEVSLEAALNMLTAYGMAEEEDISALSAAMSEEEDKRPEITVRFGEYIEGNFSRLGSNGGSHLLTVYANDEETADFTVTSSSPSVCTVQKTADGQIKVDVNGFGCCVIVVKCRESKCTLFWVSEPDDGYEMWLRGYDRLDQVLGHDGALGSPEGTFYFRVFVDGVQVTDFTVISENTNVCTAEKTADGEIELTVNGPGYAGFVVTYGGVQRTFVWYAGE